MPIASPSRPTPSRFHSGVDTWLLVLLGGTYLGTLALLAYTLLTDFSTTTVVMTVVTVVALFLPLGLVFPLYYELGETHLFVRSGIQRWRIPYERIEAVEPSRSWLSGPSLSLDRLRIVYRAGSHRRSVLISPEPRAVFIQALTERIRAAREATA